MSFGYVFFEGQPPWRRGLRRVLGWAHLVRRLQAPFVLRLLDLDRGHVLLDVGAGGGHYSFELAKRVRLAVALEIQFEPLRQLRRAGTFGRGLTACVADALALPIHSRSVDRILLSGTLQSLDASRALAECRRVLKPGGIVVAAVLSDHPSIRHLYSGGQRSLGRSILRLAKAPDTYDGFQAEYKHRHFVTEYFAPNDLVALMARHGLLLQDGRWVPGGLAGRVVETMHLLFWRWERPRCIRACFALLFPFLRLAESITKSHRAGVEWVASFQLSEAGARRS